MNNDLKEQIAGSFSRYSKSYDQYARLQKISVGSLVDNISVCKKNLPDGPVLEIGCGSGMLSESLIKLFPDREIFLLDIAPGMLLECKKRLEKTSHERAGIHYIEMDAEKINVQEEYALVVSGLTVQWFNNLNDSIRKICNAMLPGGCFTCSFLGSGSFPEWAYQCAINNVYCTLNPMPDGQSIVEYFLNRYEKVEHHQEKIELVYAAVIDFFISLKKTGTGVNVSGHRLTTSQMRKLITNWEASPQGQIKLTCLVNYLSITK